MSAYTYIYVYIHIFPHIYNIHICIIYMDRSIDTDVYMCVSKWICIMYIDRSIDTDVYMYVSKWIHTRGESLLMSLTRTYTFFTHTREQGRVGSRVPRFNHGPIYPSKRQAQCRFNPPVQLGILSETCQKTSTKNQPYSTDKKSWK